MLLVVIILGVAASLSVPRYARSFDGMKLRSGALDVAATVEHAQSMAVFDGRALRLTVAASGRGCRVESVLDLPDRPRFQTVVYELPRGIEIKSIEFDDPLVGKRSYVDFLPDGRADRCTIRVAGPGGAAFKIYVAEGLGRTRLAKVEGGGVRL